MSTLDLCTHRESESQATVLVQRDPLWNSIQAEALEAAEHDPILRPMFDRLVLNHRTLSCALVHPLPFHAVLHKKELEVKTESVRTDVDCVVIENVSVSHLDTNRRATASCHSPSDFAF